MASAFMAGVGKGEPGPYNLAGGGTLTLATSADALGWYALPVPGAAAAAAEVATKLPLAPDSVDRHPQCEAGADEKPNARARSWDRVQAQRQGDSEGDGRAAERSVKYGDWTILAVRVVE